jgi:hypothetical protein
MQHVNHAHLKDARYRCRHDSGALTLCDSRSASGRVRMPKRRANATLVTRDDDVDDVGDDNVAINLSDDDDDDNDDDDDDDDTPLLDGASGGVRVLGEDDFDMNVIDDMSDDASNV